jgi:hypothetical protein
LFAVFSPACLSALVYLRCGCAKPMTDSANNAARAAVILRSRILCPPH